MAQQLGKDPDSQSSIHIQKVHRVKPEHDDFKCIEFYVNILQYTGKNNHILHSHKSSNIRMFTLTTIILPDLTSSIVLPALLGTKVRTVTTSSLAATSRKTCFACEKGFFAATENY